MYKYKQLYIALMVTLFAFLMPQNVMSQNLSFSVSTTSITPNSEIIITNSSTNIPTGYNYKWTFTNLKVKSQLNSPSEDNIIINNSSEFSVYTTSFSSSLNNTNLNIKLELVDNDNNIYDVTSYDINIPMISQYLIETGECSEMPYIDCQPFNNLVCNGDFEYNTPNQTIYGLGLLHIAAPWEGSMSTDLYSETATVLSNANIPWANGTYISLLNTGSSNTAAAGFIGYYDSDYNTNKREYMVQGLKSQLVPGQQYTIEMDVALHAKSGHKIESLGVLFTDGMPILPTGQNLMITYTGGVAHFPQSDVSAIGMTSTTMPTQWKHLTTTFIAPLNSNLDHIVIGNHLDDANSNVTLINGANTVYRPMAYYFVDNISVTPTQPVTSLSNEMVEAEISQHNIDEMNGRFEYVIENPDLNITYVWEIISGTAADMIPSQGTSKTINWNVNSAVGSTLGRIKLTQFNGNCVSKSQEYRVGKHITPCAGSIFKNEWVVNSQSEVDAIAQSGIVYLSGVTQINNNVKFTGIDFRMAPNAKILLNTDVTLEIENCDFDACNAMWDGISANKQGEKIIITNTDYHVLEDVVYGVTSRNGADLSISGLRFFQNLYSIQILNHKDVYPQMPQTTFTSADIDVYDCAFECKGGLNLLPPYDDKGAEVGVNIDRVDDIQIGNETKLSNSFDQLKNGIKTYNSVVEIYNNKFYNINNYTNTAVYNEAAITINASNMFNMNTQSSVTIGGDNNKANLFESCYNSVYSNNSLFTIKNNVFKYGHQSIFVHNFRNGSLIENNRFKDIHYGVEVDNLLGTSKKLNISDNYFEGQNDISFSTVSISAINLTNCNSNYNSSIRTKVENNTIRFSGEKTATNEVWGIQIENCDGIIVNSNHITRMTSLQGIDADWKYSKGIRVSECIGAQITDNYIWGFGQSIYTAGNLQATQFSCNDLRIYKYGFNWGPSTALNFQGYIIANIYGWNTHNKWASHPAITDNEKLASGASANNIINTIPIKWYHYDNMGSVFVPNTVENNSGNDKINPIVNNNAFHTCFVNSGSGTIGTGGGNAGSGSSNVVNLIESIDDPELRDYMFEDILIGEEYIDLQNEYRAYDADFLYKMLSVDTTMMWLGGNKDVDYQSFFNELKEANIGQYAKVYDLIELGNFDEALEVNNAIVPEQEIFLNLKTVLGIYLNSWCKNRYTLTQNEYDVLFSIADQTPYEAGDAVYTARIMIGYEADDHKVAYRIEHNSVEKAEEGLILYPNPASDNVTIEFSNEKFENVEAQLKVYTITGKLVYETRFNTLNSFKVLSVDMLKNGVYMFQITLSNGIDKTGKLVILKQ